MAKTTSANVSDFGATERRRHILDQAAQAFLEKGFHGVGVDEIGTRSGLSGPALYRHFSGKDEILATLLDEALEELMSATRTIYQDPRADLERAIRHHIGFALSNRALVHLYHREARSLAEPWASTFARLTGRYVHSWEALLAEALPGRDAAWIAATAQACLGAVFSITAWPERVLAGSNVEEILVLLLFSGLESAADISPE